MVIPVEELKQMERMGFWDKVFTVLGLGLFGVWVMAMFYWDAVRDAVKTIWRRGE